MRPENYHLALENQPDPADIQTIRCGLAAYNIARIGCRHPYHDLAVFVRDSEGIVKGGVFGEISWGWLYLDLLWVHESIRGQGYGKKLMAAIEQAAVTHDVRGVYLATADFQALPLYQHIGYEVWGTLEDRPVGHQYYYLSKQNRPALAVDGDLVVEYTPAQSDLQVLAAGLKEHATQQGAPLKSLPLAAFVRADDGTILGGLYGKTYWNWFDLNFLWIDERLRGQGVGARLLALAEQECRARVFNIVADTTSFQALPFYQRYGFEVFGTLLNRPPGHTSYFIKKHLTR